MRASLSEPLPADVLRHTSSGLGSYRNYPVFSWPWLLKRTQLHLIAASSFAALVTLMVWLAEHRLDAAAQVFGHFTLGALLITSTGPVLATLVRHRRFGPERERRLIIASLIIGVCLSLFFDLWASEGIEAALPKTETVETPPPVVVALNVALLITIYWLFGGGLAIGRYFSEARAMTRWQHEHELKELRARHLALDTRLGLLQAQVEPHFLFNTLASVRSLISTDPALAQNTIDALVDYLRATIPRLRDDAKQTDSTLGQQIDLCESYLRVMGVRLGGRLSSSVDIEARLHGARFPPLVLITLVENALTHGIEPKPGRGHVRLHAEAGLEGGQLRVTVVDDGVGLTPGAGTGVGLSNVRELLVTRYGTRGKLSLTGAPGRGTEASVEVPLEWSAP